MQEINQSVFVGVIAFSPETFYILADKRVRIYSMPGQGDEINNPIIA